MSILLFLTTLLPVIQCLFIHRTANDRLTVECGYYPLFENILKSFLTCSFHVWSTLVHLLFLNIPISLPHGPICYHFLYQKKAISMLFSFSILFSFYSNLNLFLLILSTPFPLKQLFFLLIFTFCHTLTNSVHYLLYYIL